VAKDHPAAKAVLFMTRAPSLEVFHHDGGAYSIDLRHGATQRFFALSGEQLREINFSAEWFQNTNPSLSDLLSQLPNLVKLSIGGSSNIAIFNFPLRFLDAKSPGQPLLIPKLEELALSYWHWGNDPKASLDPRLLMNMLTSRTRQAKGRSSMGSKLKGLFLHGIKISPKLELSLRQRLAKVPGLVIMIGDKKVLKVRDCKYL
jgi:hypothetical protein